MTCKLQMENANGSIFTVMKQLRHEANKTSGTLTDISDFYNTSTQYNILV